MSKQKVFLVLMACLAVSSASTASAATTWERLGANPFTRPSLSSEADLKTLVRDRTVDLKTGFARAGYPDLYPAFMEQFPTARVDSVTIVPGDTFEWVVFKKKATGRVSVLKDTTWKGATAFEAYRFTIDLDGRRHEFVVPYACGNVALRNVTPIPPAPTAVVAPPPVRAAPVAPPPPPPVATPQVAVAPAPAPPPPPPRPAPAPAPLAPKPAAVVAPAPIVVPPPPPPPPPPPVRPSRGLLFDVGLAYQPDPASYMFARVGYEVPLFDRLYLMGLVGGHLRWNGHDGGSAFTADAMLDYHWLGGLSVGLGAGYWSGNDGQIDLLANVGFLVAGDPEGRNSSLFLEARLPSGELDNAYDYGRFGLGLRFRF